MYACVAFSANSAREDEAKQSGLTSGAMREARENNLFCTSSRTDKNTDGENRKIRLPSSIHKFNEKLPKNELAERLPAGGTQNLQSYKESL